MPISVSQGCAISRSQPYSTDFPLRDATGISFYLPLLLRTVILHFLLHGSDDVETVHTNGCMPDTEVLNVPEPCCLRASKERLHEFRETGKSREVRSWDPHSHGKPALFLLRDLVRHLPANPRQGREKREETAVWSH